MTTLDSDFSLHLLEHVGRILSRKVETVPEVLHSQDKTSRAGLSMVALLSRHTSYYSVLSHAQERGGSKSVESSDYTLPKVWKENDLKEINP